jgi:ribonuclease P protein component
MERRDRLRHTRDVRRVYEEGKSWAHKLLVLIVRPGDDQDHARVGVTASRKLGNAVARNRAKRLMREAARRVYAQFDDSWDVVLIARPQILQAKEAQVEEALMTLIEQAKASM